MSERESRPGESGPSSVSWAKVVHTVATDDPALATAVMLAISGQDANAVDDIAKRYGLTEVEAADVFRAVVGYGKRPNACYMDARGRLLLAWPEMERAPVGSRTTIGGLKVDPEAEKRVDAMMDRHMASWKTYPLVLNAPSLTDLTLTMPSATHPSGVRSLSLEEIDEVFSALDDERRQTGEDLEDRAETLAWMRREVARLDTFESTFLAVNELCPPSDWLRDLKAASHDPDALAELLRRATAARMEAARAEDVAGAVAAMDDRHNCQTCAHGGPFACNLLGSMRSEALTWRASNTTGDGCPGWEGKATGEGFQTPSAPAQPSPALFCGDGVDPLGRLGADGGFRIPRNVIKSMGLNPGDFVYVVPDGDRFVLATSDQMQAALDGTTKPPTFKGMAKLRDEGFLQELNRLVLHPAGLALALTQEDDGRVVDVTVMETEDPAGWSFGFEHMSAYDCIHASHLTATVAKAIQDRARNRLNEPDLKAVIEPPPVRSSPSWERVTGLVDVLTPMIAAAQSFILADTCLDATLYEKGAHDAAMAILRGVLSKGDPRVTLRGQAEEARQIAHALEAILNRVAETLTKTVRDQKVIPKAE